jgi:uncharacterized membrane protein YgcG
MDISRKQIVLSIVFLLGLSTSSCLTASPSSASTIYSYTEDSGTQAFTTEPHSIPERYRDRVVPLNFDMPPETRPTPPPAFVEPPRPSENTRTVTASGEYRMGDHDTRTDAVRLAVEAAKKDALEQVATYLENVTEIRNMEVTRDDIRTYTAGIVRVLNQTITTMLEDDIVVIRADLTAEVDPNEVAQAIAALRENDSAKSELMALRSETDQLQQQLDAANQALAAASSPEQIHAAGQQRQEVLDELQANALVSQAWTNWAYSPGIYSYPWIAMPGINGLLLQAQRLYPRHRHLPLAQQIITAQTGAALSVPPGSSTPPRHSLLVPSPFHPHGSSAPPAGAIVNAPTPGTVSPVPRQFSNPSAPYQLHPSHFWRPSPPNIHTAPSVPPPTASMSPRHFGGHGHSGSHFGGGHSGGGHFHGGGHRGR